MEESVILGGDRVVRDGWTVMGAIDEMDDVETKTSLYLTLTLFFFFDVVRFPVSITVISHYFQQ